MTKKRNLLFLSLFILVVLMVTSCLPKPPVTEGILKGQVIVPEGSIKAKDFTGQALSDATVNIIDLLTGNIIATTTTDSNGYYQVFVPAGGPYLLEAIKDGVKLQQFTPQVEVGIEYEMGTADCSTTAVALIAQAMMDAEDNPADIDFAAIIADPNFDDVSSIVCSTIQAGQDPAVSAVIEQAIEDFLYPPEPEPGPTVTVINIAAIPGVTVPVTGATPVTMITETAQYTGTVTWAHAEDPFLGSQVYTATITLIPKAGFTLTGVAANFFTVAGTSSLATNAVNSGIVTAVFPETAAVINISAIPGVTAPVTGATPVTMITETAQYTGTVTWAPIDNPFVQGPTYTAWVNLIPKAGFTLTGVAANFFTVAGTSSLATNAVNSGIVTAVFPETLTVIDIKTITGVTAPVIAEIPVGTITETAQYTGTVTWAPTNNPFAGRTAYTATINLTPKAGFNLTGVAANFFTVAGTSSPVTNAINSGVVTAEFPATADVAVGDSCGGGKVAYILLSGDPGYDTNIQHGLIATTSDQVGRWSDVLYNSVGTTEYEIGTGQANTTAIVGQSYCTNGAAYDCDKLTEGGYNDWFLPSLYELQKLFDSKDGVGGFGAFPYWSSSESGAENAWYHDFNDDESKILPKGNSFPFRAVRDF